MSKVVTVLEEYVRYRDGKEWKRRYVVLSKPDPKTGHLLLYVCKPFGRGATAPIEFNEKTQRQYLKDEITGFESGRHMYNESSVMSLIGKSVVYFIAFSQTSTMLRWANILNKLMQPCNFHVTLRHMHDNNSNGLFGKISPGIQGNLHVQSRRMCLIGEPSDGNKFICEWPVEILISIDIEDTDDSKCKLLKIRSNGKISKVKGLFEFEISCDLKNHFKEVFENFLRTCQKSNIEFHTNFSSKRMSLDLTGQDKCSYSYTINCQDFNSSNSEHSSSVEKRSSEIPIPRSREHSGPDQRALDDQIKMRKSKQSEMCQILNENSGNIIDDPIYHDQNSHNYWFDEDDFQAECKIDPHHHHPNYILPLSGVSQESSGVYVNEVTNDSLPEEPLQAPPIKESLNVLHCGGTNTHEIDSGYVNLSSSCLPTAKQPITLISTSSNTITTQKQQAQLQNPHNQNINLPQDQTHSQSVYSLSNTINNFNSTSTSLFPNLQQQSLINFFMRLKSHPLSLCSYQYYCWYLLRILCINRRRSNCDNSTCGFSRSKLLKSNSISCLSNLHKHSSNEAISQHKLSLPSPFLFSYEYIKKCLDYYRRRRKFQYNNNNNNSRLQRSISIQKSHTSQHLDLTSNNSQVLAKSLSGSANNSLSSPKDGSNLSVNPQQILLDNLPFMSPLDLKQRLKSSRHSGNIYDMLNAYQQLLSLMKKFKIFYELFDSIYQQNSNSCFCSFKDDLFKIWMEKVRFGSMISNENLSVSPTEEFSAASYSNKSQIVNANLRIIYELVSAIFDTNNTSNCDCFQSCSLSNSNCADKTAVEDYMSIASHNSLDLKKPRRLRDYSLSSCCHSPYLTEKSPLLSNYSTPDFHALSSSSNASSCNKASRLLSPPSTSLSNNNKHIYQKHQDIPHSHPECKHKIFENINKSHRELIDKSNVHISAHSPTTNSSNTFPKCNSLLSWNSTSYSSKTSNSNDSYNQNTGGSLKKFRRKAAQGLVPLGNTAKQSNGKQSTSLTRRKTSSMHSTMSEPYGPNDLNSCTSTCSYFTPSIMSQQTSTSSNTQNNYYNIHPDIGDSRSLSVVLDNCSVVTGSDISNGDFNMKPVQSSQQRNYFNIEHPSSKDLIPNEVDEEFNPYSTIPDEITDPSLNYGTLTLMTGSNAVRRNHSNKFRQIRRQDSSDSYNSENNNNNLRRSSCSIGSQINAATTAAANSSASSVSPSLNYISVLDSIVSSNKPPTVPTTPEVLVNMEATSQRLHFNQQQQPRKLSPNVDYSFIDLPRTYALQKVDSKRNEDKNQLNDRKSSSPPPQATMITSPTSHPTNTGGFFSLISQSNSDTSSFSNSTASLTRKNKTSSHLRRLFNTNN